MKIPLMAIEPFGVIGIPAFRVMEDKTMGALNELFDGLNHTKDDDFPLVIDAVRRSIYVRLYRAGACNVDIHIVGPFSDKGKIPYCIVDIFYTRPGGKAGHAGGPIWAAGGFK